MRNYIKKDLLGIFKTLYEAHESIKDLIARKNFDTAVSLLGDCQNTAVQIGDIIESSEGEGGCTIHMLEEYCEAAYEVSVGINDGMDGAKAKKHLDKALVKAEQSAKTDIPSRLEIVFMPYKAAMWDSLESVWIAADEDPDCDAYVVPMPYYDKNSDGSFGTFHYEGNLFPENVPITHYDAYNFENRHPDVIYIHNPYDYANNVTSVDPRFYSDKLKKVTECLVYIPYYASTGNVGYAQSKLPVYSNIDFLVTQKDSFISYYERSLPKSAFITTGSPKFDRIIKMCNDSPVVPDGWKELVNGRTVYFYNTSIISFLGNADELLEKIKYVFWCFEKHRDKCALLWRPHPLLEMTLKSMRKEYIKEFNELKEYFNNNVLGIYDNTPDVEKSIAFSDVYIGDVGTSLISLFLASGKPIFVLQNNVCSLPVREDVLSYPIESKKCDNIKEWFITTGGDLYYAKGRDFEYSFVCKLSDSTLAWNYLNTLTVNNKTYVCPCYSNELLQVDLNGIVKRFYLDKRTERCSFSGSINIGRYIFFIPEYYPAIVRFDTIEENIEYITENVEYVSGYVLDSHRCGGYCTHKEKLYIGSPFCNVMIVIDPDKCTSERIIMDSNHEGGNMTVSSDGNLIWITPCIGEYILSWNPETNVYKYYRDMPINFYCKNPTNVKGSFQIVFPFSSAVHDNEYAYFASYWSSMCVKINKNTGEIEKFNVPVDVSELYSDGYYFSDFSSWIYEMNGSKYFVSYYKKKLFLVKSGGKEFEEISISFDREDIFIDEQGFCKLHDTLPYACMENAYNSIDNFLAGKMIGHSFDKNKQMEAFGQITENADGTCGKKTHQRIKEKIIT